MPSQAVRTSVRALDSPQSQAEVIYLDDVEPINSDASQDIKPRLSSSLRRDSPKRNHSTDSDEPQAKRSKPLPQTDHHSDRHDSASDRDPGSSGTFPRTTLLSSTPKTVGSGRDNGASGSVAVSPRRDPIFTALTDDDLREHLRNTQQLRTAAHTELGNVSDPLSESSAADLRLATVAFDCWQAELIRCVQEMKARGLNASTAAAPTAPFDSPSLRSIQASRLVAAGSSVRELRPPQPPPRLQLQRSYDDDLLDAMISEEDELREQQTQDRQMQNSRSPQITTDGTGRVTSASFQVVGENIVNRRPPSPSPSRSEPVPSLSGMREQRQAEPPSSRRAQLDQGGPSSLQQSDLVGDLRAESEAQRLQSAQYPPRPQPGPLRDDNRATSVDKGTAHTSSETIVIDDEELQDFDDDDAPIEVQYALRGPSLQKLESGKDLRAGMNYPWSREVNFVMRKLFKLGSFRANQLQAINGTLGGQDVFVLMPTGGGKSLCYQLPACCEKGKTNGVTVVVSPLLSLITDQVQGLTTLSIPAAKLVGDMSAEDKRLVCAAAMDERNPLRLLYVTPEFLRQSGQGKSLIADLYRRRLIARFVIDEAHCVSQWGHDFRPHYTELGALRDECPEVPIMALTATANARIIKDVKEHLKMRNPLQLSQSFNRPNLEYQVRDRRGKNAKLLEDIAGLIQTAFRDQCGIIYCFARETCENVANELTSKHGISAHHYHAKLSASDRNMVQSKWQRGEFKVVVATIAFGMGIDKSNVRFVIHHSIPKSLEGYYQETGRAGRDGKDSVCILYYNYGDANKVKQMIMSEDKSAEQKERALESLNQVVQYCSNKVECRRMLVLRYFNENFPPEKCHNTCDNCCRKTGSIRVEDMTEIAKKAVKLVVEITNSKSCFTLPHCVDVFRGSGIAKIRHAGHDKAEMYGAGKQMRKTEAQRLFEHLCSEGVFRLRNQRNGMGFNSTYLHVGPEADKVLKGLKKINMQFEADPGAAATAGASSAAGSSRQSARQAREDDFAEYQDDVFDISNVDLTPPRARARAEAGAAATATSETATRRRAQNGAAIARRNIRRVREEDDDDEFVLGNDEMVGDENDDDDAPLAFSVGQRQIVSREPPPLVNRSYNATDEINHNEYEDAPDEDDSYGFEIDDGRSADAHQLCYSALKKLNARLARAEGLAPDAFVPDEFLQELSAFLPCDLAAVSSMERAQNKAFRDNAKQFLAVCRRYLAMEEANHMRKQLQAKDQWNQRTTAWIPQNVNSYSNGNSNVVRTPTTAMASRTSAALRTGEGSRTSTPRRQSAVKATMNLGRYVYNDEADSLNIRSPGSRSATVRANAAMRASRPSLNDNHTSSSFSNPPPAPAAASGTGKRLTLTRPFLDRNINIVPLGIPSALQRSAKNRQP